jgi:hypothetical protein
MKFYGFGDESDEEMMKVISFAGFCYGFLFAAFFFYFLPGVKS